MVLETGVFRRSRAGLQEQTRIITADGVEYALRDFGGRWVVTQSGMGMAPLRHLTQRGPFQHGVTITDFRLQPRLITLVLRNARCSRDDYWEARAQVIDTLRPNRTTDGSVQLATLRKVQPDGTRRDIEVQFDDGLVFAPQSTEEWDQWAYQEPLRLIAPDPTWFDPTAVTVAFTDISVAEELQFPITFPILFDIVGALTGTQAITYLGTWATYPVITLTGPLETPIITNDTLGVTLKLLATVPAAQQVQFDLAVGAKTVTNLSTGENLLGSLSTDSNLATWRLEPHPRATNGINNVTVSAGGAVSGSSSIAMTYNTRYIGI